MNIGIAIKLSRKKAGMKQKRLAEICGITASYLCLIEVGKRDPNISTLERIAKALYMSLPELVLLASEPGDFSKSFTMLGMTVVQAGFKQ